MGPSGVRTLRIPAALVLVPVLATGCAPAPAGDASVDAIADTAADVSGDGSVDGGAPVCRHDPMRPASDPCERDNLQGGICAFNLGPDGGIECIYIAA